MVGNNNSTSLLSDSFSDSSQVDSNTGLIRLSDADTTASTSSHLVNQQVLADSPTPTSSATTVTSTPEMLMHSSTTHMAMSSTDGHNAHPDDPGQQGTHTALLDLVPHSQATHVAIKNGSWFDASTWKDGNIPPDGAHVLIKDGVTVTYDDESNARLETIRVDGTLKFAHNADTKILVDTFVVAPSGELLIGSDSNPAQANIKTQIIFTGSDSAQSRTH